jgi:hypothetical protein
VSALPREISTLETDADGGEESWNVSYSGYLLMPSGPTRGINTSTTACMYVYIYSPAYGTKQHRPVDVGVTRPGRAIPTIPRLTGETTRDVSLLSRAGEGVAGCSRRLDLSTLLFFLSHWFCFTSCCYLEEECNHQIRDGLGQILDRFPVLRSHTYL